MRYWSAAAFAAVQSAAQWDAGLCRYGNELLTSSVISEYVLKMKRTGSVMTVSLFLSSLMAPLRDSYPAGLMRTFVTEITLLIRFPSVFSSLFSFQAVFNAPSSQTYPRVNLCRGFILRQLPLGMRFFP